MWIVPIFIYLTNLYWVLMCQTIPIKITWKCFLRGEEAVWKFPKIILKLIYKNKQARIVKERNSKWKNFFLIKSNICNAQCNKNTRKKQKDIKRKLNHQQSHHLETVTLSLWLFDILQIFLMTYNSTYIIISFYKIEYINGAL